jgi:lipopolysaccharide export system protein LptC
MLFRLFTVLAVAALAISTWILSSPAHRPAQTLEASRSDLPGYYLKNAILTDFDAQGMPTIRLEAERIDQIDHGTEVALSNVLVHYQSPNGQNWVLSGDSGRVRPGGKIIDVSGNVRLHGEGSEQAESEVVLTDTLTYDVPESTVTTKSDVHVLFGPHTLNARGMAANLKTHTIHLEQKVNGRFLP